MYILIAIFVCINIFFILVFLEIIELNICKLDYNLRKNIMRRATEESIEICEIMEDSDEEDDKS